MLKGKKTLLTGGSYVLFNLLRAMIPEIDQHVNEDMINRILEGLILIFMRLGVGFGEKK